MQTQDFIEAVVEQVGGVVERRESGILEALLPPALEPVAGGKTLVDLALDSHALAANPKAELATVGSPFLDALIHFASDRGSTSVAHIGVDRLKKKGLREEVERNLVFTHARIRFSDAEPDVFNCYYAQFNFRVDFVSDERRERLYKILVDLRTNQPNRELAERIPSLSLQPSKYALASDARRIPIADAYNTACVELRRQAAVESAQRQERIGKRFAVESARINDYYTEVGRELRRRKEREEDPKRAEGLDQKIEAAALDRDRKLRELGEKYRLRQRAALTSARLLSQPKTFITLSVDRGRATRALSLAYDSVLERLEPPVCEGCHRETTRIHVSPSAQLFCPECAENG
ncbi:MAG TPA: hypothetical protein VFJ58_30000 [Armatimonadota bacterium]|nr:hypothetical protein [Armatimonadota bacterium]